MDLNFGIFFYYNYLIIGNKPTRRKLHEARDLKINILNEKDWNKLVNK